MLEGGLDESFGQLAMTQNHTQLVLFETIPEVELPACEQAVACRTMGTMHGAGHGFKIIHFPVSQAGQLEDTPSVLDRSVLHCFLRSSSECQRDDQAWVDLPLSIGRIEVKTLGTQDGVSKARQQHLTWGSGWELCTYCA